MKSVYWWLAVVLGAGTVLGCDQGKKDVTAEPAPSAAAATETAEAPPDEATGATDTPKGSAEDEGDKSGAAPSPATPATVVAKGEKRVEASGSDVKLQNQQGSGSVTKSGGTTTVTGKSGKSIKLPMP
ncbi:MAG: hypothetical protein KF718_23200 [Polyangiaceae bacterium]|nr:hypothetical protein [Polyangiaceae bacterium]